MNNQRQIDFEIEHNKRHDQNWSLFIKVLCSFFYSMPVYVGDASLLVRQNRRYNPRQRCRDFAFF